MISKEDVLDMIDVRAQDLRREWKEHDYKNSCGACAIMGAIDELIYLKNDIEEFE